MTRFNRPARCSYRALLLLLASLALGNFWMGQPACAADRMPGLRLDQARRWPLLPVDITVTYSYDANGNRVNEAGPQATDIFDVVFYLNYYSDLMSAFGPTGYNAAIGHWLNRGLPVEGRRGSPEFDPQWYLQHYPDLTAAFGAQGYAAAASHWQSPGLPAEGRAGSAEFDPQWYLQHNPDLLAAFGANGFSAAADHWRGHGLPIEGRAASASFNVGWYVQHYPDLAAAYGATATQPANYTGALLHWLLHGKLEGRQGTP